MAQQRIRRSPAQWQVIFRQHSDCDLTARAFCDQQGIGYASFTKWRRRLSDEPAVVARPAPAFVELTSPSVKSSAVNDPGSIREWLIELDLAPGIQLRIARTA